jgi:murein L,D-transpeptidase YafK
VVEQKDSASNAAETSGASQVDPAPLPGVPAETSDLERRLAAKGFAEGSPVMIRIFKSESVLELWMRKGDRFELFDSYPICHWSGTDKQSPEGLYSVGLEQLHLKGHRPRSLNIGFPNALDRAYARTGSYILVHGGCTSTGCFAMTDPVMKEIFTDAFRCTSSLFA